MKTSLKTKCKEGALEVQSQPCRSVHLHLIASVHSVNVLSVRMLLIQDKAGGGVGVGVGVSAPLWKRCFHWREKRRLGNLP